MLSRLFWKNKSKFIFADLNVKPHLGKKMKIRIAHNLFGTGLNCHFRKYTDSTAERLLSKLIPTD